MSSIRPNVARATSDTTKIPTRTNGNSAVAVPPAAATGIMIASVAARASITPAKPATAVIIFFAPYLAQIPVNTPIATAKPVIRPTVVIRTFIDPIAVKSMPLNTLIRRPKIAQTVPIPANP